MIPALVLAQLLTITPDAPRIERFYAAALPIACDVDIESFVAPHRGARQRSRMHLVFVRAGRFHATFSTGEVLIADGQRETIFDPRSQQVTTRSIAIDHCPSALAPLCGAGFLTAPLSFTAYDGAAMNAPGLDVLVGTPRRPQAGLSKLLLYANAAGEVKRMLAVDGTGARYRYDMIACTHHVTPAPAPALSGAVRPGPRAAGASAILPSMTTPL